MATDVIMPKLGESITEGTILEWKKNVGDSISRDETILEISTDKVDFFPIISTIFLSIMIFINWYYARMDKLMDNR